MITLRPYQQEGVHSVRLQYAQRHRRVLFQLPTGGGKSYVFCHIAEQTASRGGRVLILVHRVELLDQASRSLDALGVRHGLIAAGRAMNLAAAVQVASIETIRRRLVQLPADMFRLVIVDEAHHATSSTWLQVLDHFDARVLGVTATPCRTDGRGLGEVFTSMVLGPTAQWLTDNGYLAPAKVFAPPIGFDRSQLHTRMGDFVQSEAEQQLGGRMQMGDAVSHFQQHLPGQTAIAFCCSVAHAEAVAATFEARGITAASIDGTMDTVTRRRLLERLGAGDLQVLTSCSLIGEGVDVPSVAGAIMLRPTKSLSLHLQMIGRALRPMPGKMAVILDHVGNVQSLGHHLDPVEWTLDGARKRTKAAAPSVKVCPQCFCTAPSTARQCRECEFTWTVAAVKELAQIDGELMEISARDRKREQGSAQTLDELISIGQRRGMKNARGWAMHVLAGRQAKGQWRRLA